MFGLYAINGNNWADMQSSASTLYTDFTQSAEVVSSSVGETATNPSVDAVAAVAASPSAEQTGAQASVVTKSPEQMASLEASLAQTLEAA